MQLFKRLQRRLFIFQIFLLLASSCAVAYGSLRTYEGDLEPDMMRKSDVIARSLAGQFERALETGIAFRHFRGVEELFASVRASNPEIGFIAAIDAGASYAYVAGEAHAAQILGSLAPILAAGGKAGQSVAPTAALRWNEYLVAPRPIMEAEKPVAWLLVAVDSHYIQEKISGIFYDILVVLVVSLLLTFELLLLIMSTSSTPVLALQAVFAQVGAKDAADQAEGQHWPAPVRQLALAMRTIVRRLETKHRLLAQSATASSPGASPAALRAADAALEALRSRHTTMAMMAG
ncbi:MAG: hypothetical protein U1E35_04335, partial [Rhodospirillales bacterium]